MKKTEKTERVEAIERIIADAKKDGKIITAATAGKILDAEIEDKKTGVRKPKADPKKDEAPKTEAAPVKKEKAPKEPKPEKMTKKACVIEILNRKNGGTLDDMAKLCTDRGLGEFAKNRSTSALWLGKIGFEIERLEGGIYKKKA